MANKRGFLGNLFRHADQMGHPFPPLKEQCRRHIENMIPFFANQGAPYMDFCAKRWRGLLADGIWQQTEQLADELDSQAVKSRKVCS